MIEIIINLCSIFDITDVIIGGVGVYLVYNHLKTIKENIKYTQILADESIKSRKIELKEKSLEIFFNPLLKMVFNDKNFLNDLSTLRESIFLQHESSYAQFWDDKNPPKILTDRELMNENIEIASSKRKLINEIGNKQVLEFINYFKSHRTSKYRLTQIYEILDLVKDFKYFLTSEQYDEVKFLIDNITKNKGQNTIPDEKNDIIQLLVQNDQYTSDVDIYNNLYSEYNKLYYKVNNLKKIIIDDLRNLNSE